MVQHLISILEYADEKEYNSTATSCTPTAGRESGSTTLSLAQINLAKVITEINTIIHPQAKARNQTFEVFAPHLNFEHLVGDEVRDAINSGMDAHIAKPVQVDKLKATIHQVLDNRAGAKKL